MKGYCRDNQIRAPATQNCTIIQDRLRNFSKTIRLVAPDLTQLTVRVNTDKIPLPESAEPPDSWVGRVIQGKYEIVSLIGSGGMGAVYCARHLQLQVLRALKTLKTESCLDRDSLQQALQRLLREARAVSSLCHPNIVTCHDIGETEDGSPYVVMDLLKGDTLAQLIAKGELFEVKRALEISIQVCKGLEHAHSHGILHRDIKPSNIMLVKGENGTETAMILDFGVAKLVMVDDALQQRLTRTGEIIGSPYYISPEQAQGYAIDARSDIYSLGCTIYELLKGTVPFAGETTVDTIVQLLSQEPPPLKLRSGKKVPVDLANLVMRCLEKEPKNRYQNVSDLRLDLERILSGDAIARLPLLRKLWKDAVRIHRAVPGLAPGFFAFALLTTCFLYWKNSQPMVIPEGETRLHMEQATGFERAKRYDEAIAEATRAIQLSPNLAPAYVLRASNYGNLRRWQQEADDCTAAIRLAPQFADPYVLRASAYNRLGEHRKAIDDATAALRRKSSRPALVHQILAVSLMNLGQYDRAVESNTNAIKLDPLMAQAYASRAAAYYRMHEFDRAVQDANKAIELNANLPEPYHYLALCAFEAHQFDRAVEEDTKAVKLDPEFAAGYCDRANSYYRLKLFEKGLVDCNKAISLDPKMARVYARRAEGYLNLGKLSEAKADATKAIELDPEHIAAYEFRSQANMLLGKRADAEKDAAIIVKLLKKQQLSE